MHARSLNAESGSTAKINCWTTLGTDIVQKRLHVPAMLVGDGMVELGHSKRRTLSTGCSTECVSEVLWWTHYLRRLSSLDPSFLLPDFHMILAILNVAVLLCYGSPGYYVIFRFPLF